MAGHILLTRLVFWLGITLSSAITVPAVWAQGVDPELVHALQRRQQTYSRLETVWNWTRRVPGNPEAVRTLEQDVRRAIEAYPPAQRSSVEPGVRRMYSALAYGFREEAHWILRGLGNKYAFWGDLPVIGDASIRKPYRAVIYPNGILLEGRIVQPLSQWALNEPLLLVMIAGINPLEWLKDVQVESRTDHALILRGQVHLSDAPWSAYAQDAAKITLDLSKEGTPVRIEYTRSEGTRGEIAVQDWQKYDGTWLPKRIVLKGGFRGTSQTLKLVRVQDSSMEPPEWFKEEVLVTDTRLGQLGEKGIVYRLTDQLPTIQELRAMKPAVVPSKDVKRFSWWRFIPPILLIVIGALWYWRLKRAERKASSP